MNAPQYLSQKKVNIELLLWTNDLGITHYGVRLRPWKQDSTMAKMILVQGKDVEDALNIAAQQLYINAWQMLDYTLRAWAGAVPVPHIDDDPSQFDFLASTMPPKPLFHPRDKDNTPLPLKQRQIKP